MYKSLRIKLVLLYSVSTGLILIIVMVILLIYSQKEMEEKRLEAFQSHGTTIINKLQFENTLKHSWLSQLELQNQLCIQINDNGRPLKFTGAFLPQTDRKQLLDRLSELALEEGIDSSKNPIFFHTTKSSVFTLKGNHRDMYYGCAYILPTSSGWRSLLLLQYVPNYYSSLRYQRIMYGLLGLAGLTALFVVSFCFVSRMLRPIEENNRRQNEFVAAASHELRSPLSVIRANLAAIPADTYESGKFLSGIDKECKRMARLIDDLLLLASIESKSWEIKKEPVETDTLLIETYEIFYPLYQLKERMLSLELPEKELPLLYGDKERLQQVLAILLDNALTYTPADQPVLLRAVSSDSHISLEVIDHGVGISDKDKKYIFDRFYRADQSRNDKQHFGLGLSIAKELIQLQGGKIMVRDTDGGGATFILRFKI